MVIGATVGAALVLLVVLSDALSGFLWRDTAGPSYWCSDCDLRYSRIELPSGTRGVCPRGHALRRQLGFSWTVALSSACLTVIAMGLIHTV